MSKRPKDSLQTRILFCIQALAIVILLFTVGCGASRQLNSDDIVWYDDDQYNLVEVPETRDPYYAWDFIHRSFMKSIILSHLSGFYHANVARRFFNACIIS